MRRTPSAKPKPTQPATARPRSAAFSATLRVQRINAATRPLGLSYSRFMEGLKFAGIDLDRKVLADLAVKDIAAIEALVQQAKAALEKKAAAAPAA